mmetsp:Transcript_10804/g.17066  ORF Transcript_10804/g.17066 Transcript_10804/m.17066 type:complete len:230 (-) Transcript_10804:1320-2009(-)
MEGLEIDATAGGGCIMHAACMHGTPLEIASACALIRSAAATSAACFAKRASSLTEPKRFLASSRCRVALSSVVLACPSAMAARPLTNLASLSKSSFSPNDDRSAAMIPSFLESASSSCSLPIPILSVIAAIVFSPASACAPASAAALADMSSAILPSVSTAAVFASAALATWSEALRSAVTRLISLMILLYLRLADTISILACVSSTRAVACSPFSTSTLSMTTAFLSS